MLKKSLALLPLFATAGCLGMPPEGTDAEDLAAFDEAVASVGCSLEMESDYLPVELQTGLTREQLQQVAQYRIGAKQGVLTESGGFRLLTGPCAPTEQVAEAG
ncbi:hypothetical protein M4578_00390 [Salipiger sp. P9]|uniref:hypothetical protein n=1 Tax=Salipiger pentaromativorans TaxID=2943193 RepID=UPI0021578D03|nr:hypothetical protein [Salipiger pentaromativorans]MCR8546267.1 hypothetical protein [Salipiger pentaromativorans]